jgi:carbon storage regulator CsrA
MLILTRKVDESIVITDSNDSPLAQIAVTKIDKNQVKLGIDTPVCNKIYRSELLERTNEGK